MRIITQGHRYEAANVNNPGQGQIIQFIEKAQDPASESKELYTVCDGTTNEELINILIDRTLYLQSLFPCTENADAIAGLQLALESFQSRTANREKRGVEGTNQE